MEENRMRPSTGLGYQKGFYKKLANPDDRETSQVHRSFANDETRIKTVCKQIAPQKMDNSIRNQQVLKFFIMLENEFGLDVSEYVKLHTLRPLTWDGALNTI
uniref:Uncharacterized protein n=1 Tax=Romanomermis culicivorax TaxID=13658 RepID=A0A915I7W5_ROMCU